MNYHNITKDDMLNGDGLRAVLWVAGCSHCCKGCHNPITWDPNGGIEFDDLSENEILEQLDKPHISGITFSGGDPLHEDNIEDIFKFIKKIRSIYGDKKTIWLYTGYKYESVFYENAAIVSTPESFQRFLRERIIKLCDVLVDGEFIQEEKDQKLCWKGSKNQRVIDVKKSLQQENKLIPVLYCGDYK